MDQVFIQQLEVRSVIGVYAHEQSQARPLLLDLELGLDLREAAASDQLRDAVDYAAVAQIATEFARSTQVQLVESFAERLARLLFERLPIQTLKLSVHKPGAVPQTQSVGVRIERRREDYARCGL